MGIFGALFGGDNKEMKTDFWNEIVSDEVIDDLLKRSHAEDVIIFKHSTRCFISKTVLKNVEQQVKTLQPKGSFYFLDLLKFRKLSRTNFYLKKGKTLPSGMQMEKKKFEEDKVGVIFLSP